MRSEGGSGRAVPQRAGARPSAALPPSRKESGAPVSGAEAPAQAPPPNGPRLQEGSRPPHEARPPYRGPTSCPRQNQVPPSGPANRGAAADLERQTTAARDFKKPSWLLSSPAPLTGLEGFQDGTPLHTGSWEKISHLMCLNTHNREVVENMVYIKYESDVTRVPGKSPPRQVNFWPPSSCL